MKFDLKHSRRIKLSRLKKITNTRWAGRKNLRKTPGRHPSKEKKRERTEKKMFASNNPDKLTRIVKKKRIGRGTIVVKKKKKEKNGVGYFK